MSVPEAEPSPVPLTRRFADREDVRAELENVLSGSMWVPRASDAGPLAVRQTVDVTLVLPDGRVVEGVHGRVFCDGRTGVAVYVEDLPVEVLTILTEECSRHDEPEVAPEDAPVFETPPELMTAPEHTPELERDSAPAVDAVAVPAADVSPLILARPVLAGEDRPVVHVSPNATPLEPLPPVEAPPAIAEPAAEIASSVEPEPDHTEAPTFEQPEDLPAEKIADSELSAAWGSFAAATPVVEEAPPPDAVFASSPALQEPEAVSGDGEIDFPALRPGNADPVPSIAADAGVWDDGDLGVTDLPAEKEPRQQVDDASAAAPAPVEEGAPVAEAAPASVEPASVTDATPAAEPPPSDPIPAQTPAPVAAAAPAAARVAPARVSLTMSFATLREFQKEYESNIRRGGVLVPTDAPPPIRSAVQVVFSLMNGKREVRLDGEAVFHAPTGVGVQLSGIPPAIRLEIEGLLAAAGSTTTDPPAPTTSSPVPPAAPAPVAAPVTSNPFAAPAAAPPMAAGAFDGEPLAASGAGPGRSLTATYAEILATPAAGTPFEGELVELLREAEVEGEARVEGQVGGRASWLKVLANLQAQKATGVLTAVRKAETKSFLIHQGRVVDATGRDDESLARISKKLSLLKPGAQKLLEKAAAEHDDEGAVVQAAAVWTPAEADRARRWAVLERTADVFEWDKGKYKFDPNGDRAFARPTTGVPVGHVILQGLRSNVRASGEDLARVMRPTLDRVVKIVPNTGFEPRRVGMSDKELRFWGDLDGTRTVRQLLSITPLPVSQTYRVLFALFRLGVCELEKSKAAPGPARADRAEALRERLADLKARDPFARLGLSWMAAQPQVEAGFLALRRELEPDLKAGGAQADVAKQIVAAGEEAYRVLLDPRARRTARMKLIDDPSRIEASAEMLGEKAELLAMRGDKPGAVAAIQMALDLLPGDPKLQGIGSKILR